MRTHRYTCTRCHGMMIETYSDLLSPDERGEAIFVWRCVNCGEYVDPLVLQNRWAEHGTPPPLLKPARRPVAYHRSRSMTVRQRQAA